MECFCRLIPKAARKEKRTEMRNPASHIPTAGPEQK